MVTQVEKIEKAAIRLSELARLDPATLTEAVPFSTVVCERGSCSGTVRYGVSTYTLELRLNGGRFYLMRSFTRPELVYDQVVEIILQYAAGTLYEIAREARVGRLALNPRVVVDWSK